MPVNRLAWPLAAALLLACGPSPRMQLPEKATPARTRIFLQFTVDKALVDAAGRNAAAVNAPAEPAGGVAADVEALRRRVEEDTARALGQTGGATAGPTPGDARAHLAALGDRLEARLRGDLVDRRIGLPSPLKQADLLLSGKFRTGNAGVDLDWQLVQKADQTVVAAGVAQETWFMGDVNPFADQILARLLAADVDAYAGTGDGGGPAPPPGPGPAPPAPTPGADPRAWAVIVGVEKYRESMPAATHAEADAKAFSTYARSTLGVPEAHIKTLIGERAGLADLASALEEWLPRNAREPGGRVYFFFSGHGAPDPESGKAYLVPYDADPAYLKTRGLALERLYAALAGLQGQETFVFLDACFSGSGDRSVLAQGTRPLVPVKPVKSVGGLIALAAAGPRETTGAARNARHGLFTWHLLAALGGAADTDGDRALSVDEVNRYVATHVSAEARLDNREQTPTLTVPSGVDPRAVRLVGGLRK